MLLVSKSVVQQWVSISSRTACIIKSHSQTLDSMPRFPQTSSSTREAPLPKSCPGRPVFFLSLSLSLRLTCFFLFNLLLFSFTCSSFPCNFRPIFAPPTFLFALSSTCSLRLIRILILVLLPFLLLLLLLPSRSTSPPARCDALEESRTLATRHCILSPGHGTSANLTTSSPDTAAARYWAFCCGDTGCAR